MTSRYAGGTVQLQPRPGRAVAAARICSRIRLEERREPILLRLPCAEGLGGHDEPRDVRKLESVEGRVPVRRKKFRGQTAVAGVTVQPAGYEIEKPFRVDANRSVSVEMVIPDDGRLPTSARFARLTIPAAMRPMRDDDDCREMAPRRADGHAVGPASRDHAREGHDALRSPGRHRRRSPVDHRRRKVERARAVPGFVRWSGAQGAFQRLVCVRHQSPSSVRWCRRRAAVAALASFRAPFAVMPMTAAIRSKGRSAR